MITQNSPLIVTGMHRSGTSLVTSLLVQLGVYMGDQLLEADIHNPHGYFEDKTFLQLHRQMIHQCVDYEERGWHDWGWTEGESWQAEGPLRFRQLAQRRLQQRAKQQGVWGWKDPRTTLFLDFWDSLAPNAHYLLLYRFPWEVADSMQRLGADVFLHNPEYAYPIWCYYNRRLLAFYRRHAERCLLLNVNRLLQQPDQLSALLTTKFGIQLSTSRNAFEHVFEPQQFTASLEQEPLINLLEFAHPPVLQLLRELDESADLAGNGLWPAAHTLRFNSATVAPNPSVSVIIPCYNHGEFLIEAVASVERCAPSGCELLIVNDGSQQPQTVALLKKFKQQGYRVLEQLHGGLSQARNTAIAAAQGRYILPLDADNRLQRGYIEQAIQVLETQESIGVVYGDCQEFGLHTRRRSVPAFDVTAQLQNPSIDACAVFRKQVWLDCNGYDSALPAWEDWEFWIHAAARGWQFHHLPEIMFDYRIRPNSMGRTMSIVDIRQIIRIVWCKHAAFYQQHVPEIDSEQVLIRQNLHAQHRFQQQSKWSPTWLLRRAFAKIKRLL